MAGYRLSADAKKDLTEIRHFTLERWGAHQSKKYLSALRQTIRNLSDIPSIGKHRPDIEQSVYSFPHVSHVIYYTIEAKHLVVIGVLHKSMVPLSHLEDREV